MKKTKTTKKSEIKREWHLVDVKGKTLGRVSVQIAQLLMGKDKVYYVSHLDCGDYVVVVNAAKVEISGRKRKQKLYQRHSGYPGGFKELNFAQMMKKDPSQVLRQAIAGMLPKNKLRDKRLARLKVFKEENQPYQEKFKGENGQKEN
ncbi:MAG: 50S ribosomal protein L13 [Candidatus Marinimicrobia bacterium]|nr:50S ribosomal protein L13 [Candidatus Neomarinimicrobiota bacterium]